MDGFCVGGDKTGLHGGLLGEHDVSGPLCFSWKLSFCLGTQIRGGCARNIDPLSCSKMHGPLG